MRPLENLLVVIAATVAMGSAQAQTQGQIFNLGTLSPTLAEQTDFYASGSFADVFNFTVGAAHQTVTGATVTYTPDGVDAGATHVSNLKLELFDGMGTLLYQGLNLNAQLTPGDFSARISGTADGLAGGGFRFSVAATPEPAEWMMLLAGLVVVGFMARRKTSLMAS